MLHTSCLVSEQPLMTAPSGHAHTHFINTLFRAGKQGQTLTPTQGVASQLQITLSYSQRAASEMDENKSAR